MSTANHEDWRRQALANMEAAGEAEREAPSGADLGVNLAKIGLLVVLSLVLVYALGFGAMFAVGLVGWYLFWC